jgi:hypothetical protein
VLELGLVGPAGIVVFAVELGLADRRVDPDATFGDQIGDRWIVGVRHVANRVLGPPDATVNDRVDAGLRADPVARRGQRVSQDRQAQPVRLGDRRAHGPGIELLRSGVRRRRVAAAGGDDLHGVDAGLLPLADAPDHVFGGVGLRPEEPVVTGGRRDRRAGHEQARPRDDAVANRGSDRERDVVPTAGITSGGRPGEQKPAHRGRRPDQEPLDGVLPGDVAVVERRSEVHVDVGLDEPRQQRDITQVMDFSRRRVARQRGAVDDPCDDAVANEHRCVLSPAVRARSRDAGGEDHLGGRHRHLWHGRALTDRPVDSVAARRQPPTDHDTWRHA